MKNIKNNISSNSLSRKLTDVNDGAGIELDNYFLGGRSIISKRISHLLISSSFGANAILYAAWLGYVMGLWAILIQAAWCLSFLFLARFVKTIYGFTSLHDFLGCRFGKIVQKIAALCSIIGLLYFAGWEIAIAQSSLESLTFSGTFPWIFITSLFIIIAIIYSSIGGQKTNGVVDSLLNISKFLLLIIVVIALIINISTNNNLDFKLIMPSFSLAMGSIGILGLFTNLVFNLSWQFVDNSTWQTINSNLSSDSLGPKKSLFGASGGVFITVALLGTIVGALLRSISGITSDNILSSIANIMPGNWSVIIGIAIALLLLLSMMSLIDGVSLSVSQSVMIDLGIVKKKYMENKQIGMRTARIITIIMGIFAAWGVQLFINILGGTIFDFIYVLIVAQLSLLGPIVIGLVCKTRNAKHMWIAIVLPVILGINSNILGVIFNINELVDAAGTISALSSIILAYVIYMMGKKY